MLNILNVAQTGLRTSQTQVEGVMNNIANENTEGYKKRVVDTSELSHTNSNIIGRGVSIDGVSRNTNVYLYHHIVKEEAKLNNLSESDMMLSDVESIFTEDDTSGLSVDLNKYFTSIENLRTSPNSAIYKNELKNNGNILVDNLHSLYDKVEQKQASTLDKAKSTVDNINSILKDIGKTSQDIIDSVGGAPNDLLDKRDLLEKKLSKYVDVDLSNADSYNLKIGGQTAISFGTNVHKVDLVEKYTPQQDIYTKLNADGVTKTPYESNITQSTWGEPIMVGSNTNSAQPEIQTVHLSGNANSQVYFLGAKVNNADGTSGHQTPSEIASDIANDATNVINTWNGQAGNEKKQIDTITNTGDKLTITYKTADSSNKTLVGQDADIPVIDDSSSAGITYDRSIETTKGTGEDSLTYTLNNTTSITVTNGEVIYEPDGVTIADINNDGQHDSNDTVNKNNVIKALVYKINHDKDAGELVTAYNGKYQLDKDGNKILTNDSRHSKFDATSPNKDRYLFIEATKDGEAGKFVGEINVKDNANKDTDTHSDTYGNYVGKSIEKDTFTSKEGINDIHLAILDQELHTTGGTLNPMINNLKSDSGKNDFDRYKDMLNNFAKKLSDYSSAFIEASDGTYTSGLDASQVNGNNLLTTKVGLFNGADIKSLKFNDKITNTLTQQKLDYLATIQWNTDVDFDSTGTNNTSFSKYYQTLRVDIANTRENVIEKKKSQGLVTESLNNTYDKLTKVDKDEEMVNLIKFQSAYSANAKVITTINEMLQTLLGLKS